MRYFIEIVLQYIDYFVTETPNTHSNVLRYTNDVFEGSVEVNWGFFPNSKLNDDIFTTGKNAWWN